MKIYIHCDSNLRAVSQIVVAVKQHKLLGYDRAKMYFTIAYYDKYILNFASEAL